MFGFRSDGKRTKNLEPIVKIIPHIMKARHDSQNLFKYEVLCDSIDKFIVEQRENEEKSFSYMHVVIAAIVRLIALRPQLNRFVVNGRIYRRNNIYVSFVVKKSLRDDVVETTVKLKFDGTEDIDTIKEKIDESIRKNSTRKVKNNTDKLARFLTRVPNLFIKIGVGFVKLLDRYGMLSRKTIDASPFHTSFFITNLKSIKTDYIYHHLYDFGTTGLFIAMGKEQMKPIVTKDNKLDVGKVMTLGIVTDERFCDGFYYANSLRLLKRIMENPNVLKEKLEKKVEDIK